MRHAPVTLKRDSHGLPIRGQRNEFVSTNWSGYAQTGQPYTSVQGSWTVPSVSYVPYSTAPAVEASSVWVGTGGFTDQTLIQAGTTQEVSSSGEVAYFAWYEMLPAAEIPIGTQFPVNPGDSITTSVQCISSCTPNASQLWTISITNTTEGWTFTQNFTYASSLASAEWIVEAPTFSSGISPMPDYISELFTSVATNGANPNLTLAADGIDLQDSNGGFSTPSAPINGNEFETTFTFFPVSPTIVAAVAPAAQTTTVDNVTTAFATIINSGTTTATSCSISVPSWRVPATTIYQTTNSANVPTGTPNTPVDIAAGQSQTFYFGLTPTAVMSLDIPMIFECSNLGQAQVFWGVNSFVLTAPTTEISDMITIAETQSANGILQLPSTTGVGVVVAASINIGTAATVTFTATDHALDQPSPGLPVQALICQVDGSTGQCINPTTPGPSATLSVSANQTVFFSAFVTGEGQNVSFDPAINRIFIVATQGSTVVGESSVAVETPQTSAEARE